MKKIMFNDKYGLTNAVLSGKKTMTRRAVPSELLQKYGHNKFNDRSKDLIFAAPFRLGEIVAIAQAYKEVFPNADFEMVGDEFMSESKGWNNKMFIRADLMPHSIRITGIKVERLQAISDEDCLKEGLDWIIGTPGILKKWTFFGTKETWNTRREAFAALIDKVSGKGTWDSNPWVFAYTFELID